MVKLETSNCERVPELNSTRKEDEKLKNERTRGGGQNVGILDERTF